MPVGKKGKKKPKNNFGPTKKERENKKKMEDTLEMLRLMDDFKMICFYVLRNQGWGKKRLSEFNEKWNEYFVDISVGRFSINDIRGVMLDEVGLNEFDLMIKLGEAHK